MPRTVHVLLSGLMALLLSGCFLRGFEPPKTAPPAYEQHLQHGAAFEKQGEWERAEQAYALAAQDSDKGHLALGKLHAQRGNLPEAETAFRLAMRTIRNNPELYNDLANVLLERGKNLEEAEDLAQLSVKIGNQDTFAESWNTLNSIRTVRYRHETNQVETPVVTETAQAEPASVKAKTAQVAPAKAPAGVPPTKAQVTPAQVKTPAQVTPAQVTAPKEKASPVQPPKAAKTMPVRTAPKQTTATPPKQPATKKDGKAAPRAKPQAVPSSSGTSAAVKPASSRNTATEPVKTSRKKVPPTRPAVSDKAQNNAASSPAKAKN